MRRLLSPGWLALHALAIVLVLAFLRLGWWQWERATAPAGDARSYGYALQWPAFAVFVVFMWVKMVRDELRPADRDNEPGASTAPARPPGSPSSDGRSAQGDVAVPDTPADLVDDADPELAAYNRYLATLNARAGRRR